VARTVKPEEHAAKRGEIVDAFQRLVLTKGYERMSIRDVLSEARISSGAFHHYFDSRRALLDAFVERIRLESERVLLPVVRDPSRSALDKLQGLFDTLDQVRAARKADVAALGRVWYDDANAVVRQRVDDAIRAQRAPLLTNIVRQGVREGTFSTPHPEQAGGVIMSLLQGMGDTHAGQMLALDRGGDERRLAEQIVAVHTAYLDAIERVLGAPPGVFRRTDSTDSEAVGFWAAVLRETAADRPRQTDLDTDRDTDRETDRETEGNQ
jgi:AcrR family transcriptional regulator